MINQKFWQEWFENNCTVEEEYLDYGYGLVGHGELMIDHHVWVWDITNLVINNYRIEDIPDGSYDFIVVHRNPDGDTHRIRVGIAVKNNRIDPYNWYWEEIF